MQRDSGLSPSLPDPETCYLTVWYVEATLEYFYPFSHGLPVCLVYKKLVDTAIDFWRVP